jgi:hypothetical protein
LKLNSWTTNIITLGMGQGQSNCSWTCGARKSKLASPILPTLSNPNFRVHHVDQQMHCPLEEFPSTEHSVEVYAESLYEAVLRGLGRLQEVGWESNADETIQRVEVEIHQEPTRHIVDVPKLLKWVQEDSGYPAQRTRKAKLRKLLST